MDQLKVAGEVGGWVLSWNNVPLKHFHPDVPQGAADVQAASFGREIARKSYDVLCRDREEDVVRPDRAGNMLINRVFQG